MTATSHQVIRSSADSSGFDPDWYSALMREYAESHAAWARSNGRFIVVNGRLVFDRAGHPEPEKPSTRRHTATIDPRPLALSGAPSALSKADIDRLRKVEQHQKHKELRRQVEKLLGGGAKVPTDTCRHRGREEWVVLFQATERYTAVRVTPLQAAKLVTSEKLPVVALGKPKAKPEKEAKP